MTASFLGSKTERLYDVGVAGIHRLFSHQHLFGKARVIVVVAGMEEPCPPSWRASRTGSSSPCPRRWATARVSEVSRHCLRCSIPAFPASPSSISITGSGRDASPTGSI
ncbi:MAG: hypothetical protein MZV70_44970 [Desulfobacterales bacterium]|nr:hypothetical protein [Desulfobacterales bacterium]